MLDRQFFQVKLWSSQSWTQFQQLHKLQDCRTSMGFEPMTLRYRCDALTIWAMKPLMLGAGHLWVLMFSWWLNHNCKDHCVTWFYICISRYDPFHISFDLLRQGFVTKHWFVLLKSNFWVNVKLCSKKGQLNGKTTLNEVQLHCHDIAPLREKSVVSIWQRF